MHETLEELLTYIRMVWSHKWIVLICAFPVCLVGWTAVALLPNTYRVRATVQIERSSMLQPLLKGIAVESDIAKEMAGLMRQTMLVRPTLESIARDVGLDKMANIPEKFDVLVSNMETQIDISAGPDKKGICTVSYEYSDPYIAQRVVQALITRFLDTIVAAIRTDSENTKRFFDQQIVEYRDGVEAAEQKVKEFKEKHLGMISEDGRTYYARLQEAKRQYQGAVLELQEAEHEAYAIRAQRGPSEYPTSNYGKVDIVIDPIDARIQQLEKALADLQLKFTDQHPDVISTKRTIEQLKEQKGRELPNPQSAKAAGDAPRQVSVLANPAYQSWKTQLTRAEAKLAALRSRVGEYKRRGDELQQDIGTVPQLEAELAGLNREYLIHNENYQKMVGRRESATISGKVESANDLKFNILEPPQVPVRPIGPNRLLRNTVVLLFGIGAGVGMALLVSLIKPSVYTRRDLRKITDLPILGTVSVDNALIRAGAQSVTHMSYFLAFGGLVAMFVGLNLMYLLRVKFVTNLAGYGLMRWIPF